MNKLLLALLAVLSTLILACGPSFGPADVQFEPTDAGTGNEPTAGAPGAGTGGTSGASQAGTGATPSAGMAGEGVGGSSAGAPVVGGGAGEDAGGAPSAGAAGAAGGSTTEPTCTPGEAFALATFPTGFEWEGYDTEGTLDGMPICSWSPGGNCTFLDVYYEESGDSWRFQLEVSCPLVEQIEGPCGSETSCGYLKTFSFSARYVPQAAEDGWVLSDPESTAVAARAGSCFPVGTFDRGTGDNEFTDAALAGFEAFYACPPES